MNVKQIMQTNFLTFTENDEISKVIGALIKQKKRSAVVLDSEGNYLGVVSRRLMLSRKYDGKSKVANVLIKTPIILEDLDLLHCAKLMHATGVQNLPVERKGKLVGLLQLLDLLKELSLTLNIAKAKVQTLNLAKPKPLKSTDTVSKALTGMIKQKIDNVLVFRERELEGVLSIRDVLRVSMQNNERISNPGKAAGGMATRGAVVKRTSPLQLPVESFISKGPLLTVTRKHSLSDAIALMYKRNIRDLIVQEEGKVFGLITVKDLLRAFVAKELKTPLNLSIRGMKKLQMHDLQEARVLALIRSEVIKLQSKVGEELSVVLHMKIGKVQGRAHQYDLRLKVEGKSGILMTESAEWKLDTAIRKAFRSLVLSMQKKSVKSSGKQIGRKRVRGR